MSSGKFTIRFRDLVLEIILVILCLGLAFGAPGFFTLENLLNVLRNVSMQGVVALAMTMVIIGGEIDLSVGSMVAFSGCVTAWLTIFLAGRGLSLPPAILISILAALALCAVAGAFTGWLRVRFRVPTFITTLAWLTMLRGAAELITNGFPLTPFPEWFNFFGGGHVAGIPFPSLVFIGIFLLIQFVMNYTTFGRAIYAVGGNAEAARLSGIPVGRIKIAIMVLVAVLAGLSGVMQASQIMSGSATTAVGWELDVIAAVIIGGASLMGGAGRVWGTLIGVVFLGVLVNGMTLLNVNEYWQHVVRGALILGAVLLNTAGPAGGRRS